MNQKKNREKREKEKEKEWSETLFPVLYHTSSLHRSVSPPSEK
jgi:hypothetical protein